MDLGVFIPSGSNGWLISTTLPQYLPSFDLNRTVLQKAEAYGFDFALSMIKLRGFGGPSKFWNHNPESFTLMAGLAAVTSKIRLYASVAVLTIPPAIVARMVEATATTGQDCRAYVRYMVSAAKTDEAAVSRWEHYRDGVDLEAVAWLTEQAGADTTADKTSTARWMAKAKSALNFNMGLLVGSVATVARLLDEAAEVPGTSGIMLVFDDFLAGMDDFGQRVKPLMRCRAGRTALA